MSAQRNKRFTLVLSLFLTVALLAVVGMPGLTDYWTGVNIKQIGGTEVSGATLPVTCAAGTVSTLEEDAAHSSGAEGFPSWTVRTDTAASSAGTDGDYATLNSDSLGRLWITGTYLEDVNETAGSELLVIGTVRRDTAASSAGSATDYATLNTDAAGRLWISGAFAEDAAHTSSDVGIASLVVRADTVGTLAGTTGDYTLLLVDANGAQWTHPLSIGTEDAAETAAGSLDMAGSVRRDAAASSAGTSGDNATINTDATGKLWVSGAFAEDAAHTTSDIGLEALAVRSDTLAALAGTTGDYTPLQVTAAGGLWTTPTGTGVEDVAETAAGDLLMAGTVRRDAAASSAGTSGDNATLNTDSAGALWTHDTAQGVEDAAETAGGNVLMAGTVRRDTLASSAGTTGDNATLNTNAVGALYVIEAGAAALTCGQENIDAAGTAEQLGSNACKEVTVTCFAGNTSACYIAHATGDGTATGMEVAKGTSVTLKVSNTNLLWVDAGTNDDDVGWCCTN